MANFNFYLNRQGSRGRQGVKGDKGENGYSPYIDIKSNTPTEFIMTIHNETESFDTPNLIPTAIGEKVTEMDAVLTTHTEDIANLQGDLTNLSEEVNTLSGEVASNSADITAIKNKDNAQDSDIAALKTRVGGTEESIEDLNHKYTVLGSEVSDLSVKKQNKLVQGDNITLTDNADGTTTISASGGGGGGGSSDVTAAGNNRFTGDNTFTGKVNIAGGALTVDGVANLNQTTAQYLNAVSITSSGEINAVSIKANGLRSDDIQTTENKKYLTELDVDNQTIQVVNGKLHANLDELGNEVNDLTGRVTTNEAEISAIKTGKQNKLKAGTNITLTDNPDGTTTVASTGGGGTGDVTAAGDNTFTGSNTFTSTTTFNAPIAVSGGGSTIETSLNGDTSTNIDLKVNSQADLILGTGTVATQDADGGTHIRDGQIKDTSGNILLSQGNVTAGNNITITKTGKGIQIASSGGGSTPANMVTTDTNQDITGIKTFKGDISNNDPSIIFGGKRIGLDDSIGGKIKVNGNDNFEISTGAKGANSAIFRLQKSTNNDPCYFDFTSNATTMKPTIRLGNTNYQGTIEYDTSTYPSGFLFKTQNALSGYPYSSFKIGDNTLTFKKTDGTVVDLLAGGGASIDDSTASNTSTYSSSKIEKLTNITSSDTSITVTKSDTGVDIVANKDLVTGYSFPTTRYVDLTLGASGSTYTAPANGWFSINKLTNAANQFIYMGLTNKKSLRWSNRVATNGISIEGFLPVSKGSEVTVSYSAGGDLKQFIFVYAQGAESEAQ